MLVTLGDHLRKVRLDRSMSQPQVARVLKASSDMVTNWELNRNEPTAKFAKLIIEFLGYFPFSLENLTFCTQLYYARLIAGMTQEEVAKKIGCDESNLRYIELGLRIPHSFLFNKIQDFINNAL